MPLSERVSGDSSNELEMINTSMEHHVTEEYLQTTNSLSEIADGSLSCVDCSMKQERIENLQKLRSKQKTRILMLPKENMNLQKVCCSES